MAISYPLALVSTPAPKSIRIIPHAVVGMNSSIFTGQQQLYAHQGQFWQAEIQLPIMNRATAEPWLAWLLKLNGKKGTFRMGDPAAKIPRGVGDGSPGGSPQVDGGSQTGQELDIKNAPISLTGWLLAGDYIQVGDYLYKLLNDADTDGAGDVTVDIWPRLRTTPSDSDAVTISNCTGLFRLASNDMPWTTDLGPFYGVSFNAIEAI